MVNTGSCAELKLEPKLEWRGEKKTNPYSPKTLLTDDGHSEG